MNKLKKWVNSLIELDNLTIDKYPEYKDLPDNKKMELWKKTYKEEYLMKTLGDLRVGDNFWVLYWEGGYIVNIFKATVSIIQEIPVGVLIKYFKDDILNAFCLEKAEYDSTEIFTYFCKSVVVNKEQVLELIEKDKAKFNERHNKLLKCI